MSTPPASAAVLPGHEDEYTVVARRYRPQQFAELIGQEHVAQSLVNALKSGRVAHAYLFTGARGVGKTSAARILAKALNCATGTTPTPCDKCESCLAIAQGEDVDVLEIDGASNNKVDEVRDLRQNVGFLPTRGRYKIYIIDEVHMLTTQAFNALLKTLEEPPAHVKFILATTEVQKIPVTILSRCQRYDFAFVGPAKIYEQLKSIVAREGHQAEDAALKLIAHRAGGSMRDSQSLLDQLLSSSQGALTAEHVHHVLGTAGADRVIELTNAILARDPAQALGLLAQWVDQGMQIGELVDQLVEHWRSLMLARCAPELERMPGSITLQEVLGQHAEKLTLDSILAGLDIWTTTKARMRGTSYTRLLIEVAIVRLCRIEEVLGVSTLLQSLANAGPTLAQIAHNPAERSSTPARLAHNPTHTGFDSKKNDSGVANLTGPQQNEAARSGAPLPLTEANLPQIWNRFLEMLKERSPILAGQLKFCNSHAIFGPNSLAIRFPVGYTDAYEACRVEQSVTRMQEVLQRVIGQAAVVRVEQSNVAAPAQSRAAAPSVRPAPSTAADRKKNLLGLPLFKKAAESLGAQIWHVDEDFNPTAPPPAATPATDPDEN